MSTFLRALAQNVNALLFLLGFAVLYVGVSGWSVPAARVIAGLLIILLALWPYLKRTS